MDLIAPLGFSRTCYTKACIDENQVLVVKIRVPAGYAPGTAIIESAHLNPAISGSSFVPASMLFPSTVAGRFRCIISCPPTDDAAREISTLSSALT